MVLWGVLLGEMHNFPKIGEEPLCPPRPAVVRFSKVTPTEGGVRATTFRCGHHHLQADGTARDILEGESTYCLPKPVFLHGSVSERYT